MSVRRRSVGRSASIRGLRAPEKSTRKQEISLLINDFSFSIWSDSPAGWMVSGTGVDRPPVQEIERIAMWKLQNIYVNGKVLCVVNGWWQRVRNGKLN